ncbi:NADH dehydrogenase [ubiquinone] 1 subunit C2 [Teleopsis dalmanni]|uniref:NADH dehydrogenase [ubiquinone] 1 subunit C2 n=1 Tax=Teleopsis dalmanni TaxID=139649 RepID=UPI0018CFE03E|nr:NADH dehydrogenase [ubiquinone] 1 subunit C2 [Teleopsis dalmanni]
MSNLYDPLELLTNKGDRELSVLAKWYNPVIAAACGFGVACFVNFGMRKPIFSGIQQHIGFTAIGGALGLYFDGKRDAHLAKRDAVLRHYVETHPDLFPVTERKKFGEVLEPWVPIR